jgi:hypothetical protein
VVYSGIARITRRPAITAKSQTAQQGHDMFGDEIAGQFAGKLPDEPFTTYCDRALVQQHTM